MGITDILVVMLSYAKSSGRGRELVHLDSLLLILQLATNFAEKGYHRDDVIKALEEAEWT